MKIIKSHNDIVSYFIYHNFNNSLFSSIFPSELKKADIIPIHKNKSKFDIENYCPASILPFLSKIYERCIFHQMSSYFNQILSKHQRGYRQGHSFQRSLLLMVEKLTKRQDNNGIGLLLPDLSQAFDSLRHNLLITKPAIYCFDQPSLCFVFSYLSDRTQRTKVNNAYILILKLNMVFRKMIY